MMMMSPVADGGGVALGSFLPLHQPILQLPVPSPRAIRAGFASSSSSVQQSPESQSIKDDLSPHLPESFVAAGQRRRHQRRPSPATTTRPPFRRFSTETTTEEAPPRSFSFGQFHYDGIQSGEEGYGGSAAGVGPTEDDAVVLLVGLFNLLAVVVYAANQYVRGKESRGLSERVIRWQVQKVLDEMVIKVHSSQYAANLLSRAMPSDASSLLEEEEEEGRSSTGRSGDGRPFWLASALRKKALRNTTEAARWLHRLKERLTEEVGSSPAALATVRLRPSIYEPLQELYAALAWEGGPSDDAPAEGGRGLATHVEDLSSLLGSLSKLSLRQLRSTLAALTALGRAQQRVNVVPALASALRGGPAHWGRRDDAHRRSTDALAHLLRSPGARATGRGSGGSLGASRRYARHHDADEDPPRRRSRPQQQQQQLMRRQGVVEDDRVSLDASPSGHWTDRWFSLVTQVSPVGLDMTTLYARARARPTCLRALLCRANNAWRQVGPVQAALTPFASVVMSWILEDVAPHTLGDSLIAVRAGWMGKDCTHLYPECPLHPDPHPAAKEAITFFSRLQYVATQPPKQSSALGSRPQQVLEIRNTETERINSSDSLHIPYSSNREAIPVAHVPQPQYLPQDPPLDKSSSQQPAHTYQLPETEQPQHSTEHQIKDAESNNKNAAASFQAYYDRYGGKGPMSVPGSEYSSKYGQMNGEEKDKNPDELYEKYDSLASSSAEGAISDSNSVSGMALQDLPTGSSPQVWEKFFKAGLYGSNIQQTPHQGQKEEQNTSNPAMTTRLQQPLKRQSMSSLNKMGMLYTQDFPKNNNINHERPKYPRPNRPARPYFSLRSKQRQQQTTYAPSNTPTQSSATPLIKKYKYGLRRGLPAGNVNGYNSYMSNGNLYQQHKPWYIYTTHPKYQPTLPSTTTTTTTTRPSTTNPLSSKDIAPFGPEDAVTDILRNELLYEFIRDRQGSIPLDERSLS